MWVRDHFLFFFCWTSYVFKMVVFTFILIITRDTQHPHGCRLSLLERTLFPWRSDALKKESKFTPLSLHYTPAYSIRYLQTDPGPTGHFGSNHGNTVSNSQDAGGRGRGGRGSWRVSCSGGHAARQRPGLLWRCVCLFLVCLPGRMNEGEKPCRTSLNLLPVTGLVWLVWTSPFSSPFSSLILLYHISSLYTPSLPVGP